MKKMENKILAVVKVNNHKALVLGTQPVLKYKRIGHKYIYGTDGLFYHFYKLDKMFPGSKAFGGRKFNLTMEDGEVVECYGQWWDGGHQEISEYLGLNIRSVTIGSIENLKKCYVYQSFQTDLEKYNEFIKSYTGTIFEYRDYEKILTFDDMRHEWIKRYLKEQKAKENAIGQAKKHFKELKNKKYNINN